MPCQYLLLDLITLIMWLRVQIMKLAKKLYKVFSNFMGHILYEVYLRHQIRNQ
jgi:hypothetical protein